MTQILAHLVYFTQHGIVLALQRRESVDDSLIG